MDRLLRPHLTVRKFDCAVGDDFIDVHIGLRTAASLPDPERELIIELSRNNFIRGLSDELSLLGWKFAEILIHQRAGFLENSEGANQLGRHSVAANVEVE